MVDISILIVFAVPGLMLFGGVCYLLGLWEGGKHALSAMKKQK